MAEEISGLAFIKVKNSNPLTLFKEWQQDFFKANGSFMQTHCMCLATCTKDGKVSNRNVLVKDFDENGFVFVTNNQSRKAQDIKENPWVAATFIWNYKKGENIISRQVRMEGKIHEIDSKKLKSIYDAEKSFCKVRAILCHQGQEVNWENLKQQHDALVNDVVNNKNELPMPDQYIGYQLVPEKFDCYYGYDRFIADRVIFTKIGEGWKYVHVAA